MEIWRFQHASFINLYNVITVHIFTNHHIIKTQDEKDAAMDSITANLYNQVIPN